MALIPLTLVPALPGSAKVVEPQPFSTVGGEFSKETYNFGSLYRKLEIDLYRAPIPGQTKAEAIQLFVNVEIATLLDIDWVAPEDIDFGFPEDEADDFGGPMIRDTVGRWRGTKLTLEAPAQSHHLMAELFAAARDAPLDPERVLRRPPASPVTQALGQTFRLEWTDEPWHRLPDQLSEALGVPVEIDWPSLVTRPLNLDERVSGNIDGRLDEALPQWLAATGLFGRVEVRAGTDRVWVASPMALRSVGERVFAIDVRKLSRAAGRTPDDRFEQMLMWSENWPNEIAERGPIRRPDVLWGRNIFFFRGIEPELMRLCELIVAQTNDD
ncbi:MAG: hypothetical protein AAF565_19310 [Pseudomonadota bacterium]